MLVSNVSISPRRFYLPPQTTPFTLTCSTSPVPLCPYATNEGPESCTAVYSLFDLYDVAVSVSENWLLGYNELTIGKEFGETFPNEL